MDRPWITTNIKRLQKEKEKSHKKAKLTNRPEKWEDFRTKRNNLQHEIRKAKTTYNEKLAAEIEECTAQDEKLWWKLTKKFYNKSQNRKAQNPPLLIDDKLIEDNKGKAEAFVKYFTSTTTLDTSNAPDLPEPPIPEEVLSNIRIQAQTVKEILQNLNPNKACGPDKISPRMLKETAEVIAPSLARLFNFSIATGSFPDTWKTANITPLHKKNQKHLVQNYRPISLLSSVGKCLERCVNKELLSFLLATGSISPLQSAFTPKNSTTYQLLELYHHITAAMDKGKDIRFIFLDFSKAFDRVWHAGLLHKLKEAGIGNPLLKWFKSYLSNRKHRVVVEGEESGLHNITAGVPQGSVLGPILFILYINALIKEVNIEVRVYADDATLYIAYDNPQTSATTIEENLANIQKWADDWYMSFNPQKTESLTFTRKRDPIIPTIRLNGVEIKEVSNHKHLGITLQRDAKWSTHIAEITSRAKRRLDVLRSYAYTLDRRSIEKLYISYIRPILEYSDTVWDNCRNCDKEALENIQLEAARLVTGAKRKTIRRLLYEDVQWETLETRRQTHKLITMYKIQNDLTTTTLQELLTQTTAERHDYNVRSQENLTVPRASTTTYQQSFFPSSTKLWNNMDPNQRNLSTLEAFKESLKSPKEDLSHYLTGKRCAQILHARLRLESSDLAVDMARLGLTDDVSCACGNQRECAEHYLLKCNSYQIPRTQLLFELNFLPQKHINTNTLLKGSKELSQGQNKQIFIAVQKFIMSTNRFNK
jgi:histone H3/H4